MKVKLSLMTVAMGMLVAASGYSQTPNPSQSNSPVPDPNSQQAPTPGQNSSPEQNSPRAATPTASDMTFEGRLLKIDTVAKTINVAGLSGKEGSISDMTFKYDESTIITGGDKTAQGLDGKTGSLLKVTYQPDHETNKASRIEISDKP